MIDQTAFLMLFFESRPNEEIDVYDVSDAVRRSWLAMTGEKFRDPDRLMRQLRKDGVLDRKRRGGVVYYSLKDGHNDD